MDLDEKQRLWSWLPLTEFIIAGVINAIRSLPREVFLRTADALHLVTAENNRFREIYSNDTHLLAAAGYFGLEGKDIINPA
jgi:predicted nucleic acid-binding protein